ncbi:MAG: flagellar motor switch protein FliN [bacterium]|nr:flagellar motor switch protein FliN [bacterium]
MTDENKPENPEIVDSSEDNAGQAGPPQEDSVAAEVAADNAEQAVGETAASPESTDEVDSEADMLKMLDDLPEDDSKAGVDDIDFGTSPEVSDAEFQQLSQPAGDGEPRNIEMLMDVNLPVAIELGRTRLAISSILALGPGSVVELNKLAGEPIDVLVNNKPIAKGEVVVVDENFGVRITQLLTSEERLRALGDH